MDNYSEVVMGITILLSPIVYFMLMDSLEDDGHAGHTKDASAEDSVIMNGAVKYNKASGMGACSGNEYEHQVAGHTREVLICGRDRIFKPMIKPDLFRNEIMVYESARLRGKHIGLSLSSFTPAYHGCIDKSASTGIPKLYLELNNLTTGFKRPCACDIKMGMQTYEPNADVKKIQRENAKYTYQKVIGFRITGFKVFNMVQHKYYFVDKVFGRSLVPDTVKAGLAFFFFDGVSIRRDVIVSVIDQLEKLHVWIKSQTQYQFYCSSILIVYDARCDDGNEQVPPQKMTCLTDFLDHCRKETCNSDSLRRQSQLSISSFQGKNDKVHVKLIDFAHVHAKDRIGTDTGYLFGLVSLLTRLYEIMVDIDNQCDPFIPFTNAGYRIPHY
jgi:hypothetical protein